VSTTITTNYILSAGVCWWCIRWYFCYLHGTVTLQRLLGISVRFDTGLADILPGHIPSTRIRFAVASTYSLGWSDLRRRLDVCVRLYRYK